jgi:hypothetical protein
MFFTGLLPLPSFHDDVCFIITIAYFYKMETVQFNIIC